MAFNIPVSDKLVLVMDFVFKGKEFLLVEKFEKSLALRAVEIHGSIALWLFVSPATV